MTTIAFDGKSIACDSQLTSGGRHTRIPVQKMTLCTYKGYPAVAATAGDWVYCRRFHKWAKAGCDTEAWNVCDSHLDNFEGLIVYATPKRIICLTFDATPDPYKVGKYYAIGTGDALAIGAMAMGATAKQAVQVACAYDIRSEGPVISYSFQDGRWQ